MGRHGLIFTRYGVTVRFTESEIRTLDEAADIVGVTTYELLCQAVDRAGKASTHSPPEKGLEEVQKGS